MFAIIDGRPYLVSNGTAYPTTVMPETEVLDSMLPKVEKKPVKKAKK